MRRALPALVLAFAACSSDPTPPADAGPADTGATTDLGAPDAGQPDTGNPADTAPPADQGAPADTGPLDAGSAVDVSPAADADASLPPGDDGSALDAGPTDTGVDVPRVGLDTGPRDTGPVDAQGVQSYPLDPPPGETQVRVLYEATCQDRDGGVCSDSLPVDLARNASCSRMGTRLSFTLTPCVSSIPCTGGFSITGAFPDYRSVAGASIAVIGGGATQGRDFVIESGSVVGGRQSFRVSFSAPPTGSVSGVTGVPGRTISPDRGDLWLLGCPVQ